MRSDRSLQHLADPRQRDPRHQHVEQPEGHDQPEESGRRRRTGRIEASGSPRGDTDPARSRDRGLGGNGGSARPQGPEGDGRQADGGKRTAASGRRQDRLAQTGLGVPEAIRNRSTGPLESRPLDRSGPVRRPASADDGIIGPSGAAADRGGGRRPVHPCRGPAGYRRLHRFREPPTTVADGPRALHSRSA